MRNLLGRFSLQRIEMPRVEIPGMPRIFDVKIIGRVETEAGFNEAAEASVSLLT